MGRDKSLAAVGRCAVTALLSAHSVTSLDVVHHADALAWLRGARWLVRDGSMPRYHAVFADPPYGLAFMAQKWDTMTPREFQAWVAEWAALLLEVVYPGALLMMFGGTRTYHRLACGLEDAGWEIYDSLMYVYGSGFPKSHRMGCKCEGNTPNEQDHKGTESEAKHDLRDLRREHVSASGATGIGQGEVLQPRVSEQGAPGNGQASGIREVARREQPGLEGGSNLSESSRELQADQVCEVSARISFDGAEGRLCDGASSDNGDAHGESFDANRSCASQKPQPAGQSHREPGTVSQQRGTQTGRSAQDKTCPVCGGLIAFRGYGTALKPAFEPIVLARAPRTDTYAKQALTYGTGALNIDGCRIAHNEPCNLMKAQTNKEVMTGSGKIQQGGRHQDVLELKPEGRWPANVILDEHAAAALDQMSGELSTHGGGIAAANSERSGYVYGQYGEKERDQRFIGDAGGASRFFKTVNSSPACVLCNLPIGVESSRITPYPTEGEQWQIASSVDESTSPASLHSGSVHAPAPQSGPHKNEGNSPNSGGPANNVGASSRNTSPTGTPIAPNNAPMMQGVRSALSARFAESLCDSCVTAIAQSVVVTQQGQGPASRLCQACMPEHSAQILSHNLVRFAESLDNTDTTTITANLNRLLGFVQLAIESIIAERSSASAPTRFSYHSKASSWEREAGLRGAPVTDQTMFANGTVRRCPEHNAPLPSGQNAYACGCPVIYQASETSVKRRNVHPTVKPILLTEYLARLLLPPELDEPRRLLVPFAGVGSEIIGARLAGWDVVTGIEQGAEYVALARPRIAWWAQFSSYEQARAAYQADRDDEARVEAERAAGVEQLSLLDTEAA